MLTTEQMIARIAELEKLQANSNAKGTALKISKSGGVSFYGLGRWPVTLYASQWDTLFSKIDEIKAFVNANRSLLAKKETKDEQPTA